MASDVRSSVHYAKKHHLHGHVIVIFVQHPCPNGFRYTDGLFRLQFGVLFHHIHDDILELEDYTNVARAIRDF